MATVENPGSAFDIALSGDVDLAREAELEGLREAFESSGQTSTVVDLSEVTFFDSAGLNFLVALRQLAHSRGGSIVLRRPTSLVLRLLEIVGLQGAFELET